MQQKLKACAAQLLALAASVREQSNPTHLAHAIATGFEHMAQAFEHGLGIGAPVAPAAAVDQVVAAPAAAAAPAASAVTEQELATQATAPRVTQADVDANIASEHYLIPSQALCAEPGQVLPVSLSLLTICVLTLRNGFTVTGESACASPENFDAAIGQRLARENAVRKIWPLMGYELRSKLAVA